MSNSTNSTKTIYARRVSDKATPTVTVLKDNPTNKDILDAVLAIQKEVTSVRTILGHIDDAFITNDIGKKDYEGHRLDHLYRKKRTESFENAKLAGTFKVIGIVLVTLFGVFTTGLSVHLQKLLGN